MPHAEIGEKHTWLQRFFVQQAWRQNKLGLHYCSRKSPTLEQSQLSDEVNQTTHTIPQQQDES